MIMLFLGNTLVKLYYLALVRGYNYPGYYVEKFAWKQSVHNKILVDVICKILILFHKPSFLAIIKVKHVDQCSSHRKKMLSIQFQLLSTIAPF